MVKRVYTKFQKRIGYDFYADIAERIVEKRKSMSLTQAQLAKKTSVPSSRITRYEQVRIRFLLKDIEKIAKGLQVTTDYLIGAEYDDPDCDECLYLVWNERFDEAERFGMYFKASSPQMAFLKAHKWSVDAKCIWFEARDRAIVELVGVPVKKSDYAHFRERNLTSEDPIEPE